MATEFANAALEYPVVFGETGAVVIPAAVLGLRADENLYVGKQGGWQAKYIPAFIRRYPFVFSSSDEGKTFTLCIDETFPGINQSGRGERLFGADDKPTSYLGGALKFLQQYQFEFQRTKAFCNKLKDLNVLEPIRARLELGSGERMALAGFAVVNRARLKALSAELLAKLVHSDELECVYSHLLSLGNFARLKERLDHGTQPSGHDAATGSSGDAGSERSELHPAR